MLKQIKTGRTYNFRGQSCTVVTRVQGGNDKRVHVRFADGTQKLVWSDDFRSNAQEATENE